MDQVFAVRQCVKSISQMGNMYSGHLWISIRYTILSIDILCGRCLQFMKFLGKMLKAVQSFYVDSRACVLVRNDVSEWFPVNVGLRKGRVLSSWCLMYTVYGWCGSSGEC